MPKIALVSAVVALAIGLAAGFFFGRMLLERQWSQPFVQISPDAAKKSGAPDADPTPKAGTTVLKAMPMGKGRAALRAKTEKDPVVATVASFGADSKKIDLNVIVENRGKCTITSVAGVAYGFDPYGKPAAVNKAGESYLAFEAKAEIAPGAKDDVSQTVKFAQDATLALAQIDHATCSDGTTWTRQ